MRWIAACLLAVSVIVFSADGFARPPGGPFIMKDHTGRVVTNTDFYGRYQLVYFGYTFCPDICPTGLQTISDALDLLGEDGEDVVPMFVTVDPERDTIQVMADYVANFHPRLVGLTGTPVMVEGVAKKYKIRFEKVVEPGREPGEYIMDHTASVLFMGTQGEFLAKFAHGISPEDMAKRIRELKNGK